MRCIRTYDQLLTASRIGRANGGLMLRGLRLLVPALLLTASACSHSGGGEVKPEIRETGIPAYVEVDNQHALPMEVYAFASGITQRLGTVHPGMNSRFTIPQNLIGNGSVRFEARPSGGGQPFRSGEILLEPGSVVDLRIAAQLFNSTVTRRP
jgi:hypothetical protein